MEAEELNSMIDVDLFDCTSVVTQGIPTKTKSTTKAVSHKTKRKKSEKIYLKVPFDEKDEAKALGAKWDGIGWFYTNPKHASRFTKWSAKKSFLKYDDLTEEQQQLIDFAKEGYNVFVDACIGSGKTSTIQVLCNELKSKKILYLTYNKLLKFDAQEKIVQQNSTITNYHGFAYGILKKNGIKTSISDIIQTFLKHKPPIDNDYELLILDEYQDIDTEISELLLYIKEYNPNMQIIVVGDMSQKIYDKTSLNVENFIKDFIGAYKSINFTYCFRIGKEWSETLSRLWKKRINGINKNFSIRTMPLNQVVSFLSTKEPREILCLGARTGDMAKVLNRLENDYIEKFNKKTVYASIREEGEPVAPNASNAIFTTFDGAKGLERPICVVFDFTESYWQSRTQKPMTKYEIIRNIFCVAASRGKEQIILVQPETPDTEYEMYREDRAKDTILSEETISKSTRLSVTADSQYEISDMFDFKFKEDIENCYNLLDIKQLQKADAVIEVEVSDHLIDLSPCIGIWQEAAFFDKYDIDEEISFARAVYRGTIDITLKPHATLEEKILYLLSLKTHQYRYNQQAKREFVRPDEKQAILERLKTQFTGDENVQTTCCFCFEGKDGIPHECVGRCDVNLGTSIVELKFKSELRHEDFLQLACYLVAMDCPQGFIWNVKDNQMYMVTIPDKQKFMDAVIYTITKRAIKEYVPTEGRGFMSSSKEVSIIGFLREKGILKEKELDTFIKGVRIYEIDSGSTPGI